LLKVKPIPRQLICSCSQHRWSCPRRELLIATLSNKTGIICGCKDASECYFLISENHKEIEKRTIKRVTENFEEKSKWEKGSPEEMNHQGNWEFTLAGPEGIVGPVHVCAWYVCFNHVVKFYLQQSLLVL